MTSVFTLISFHNYENIFDHVRYVAQNILMIVQGSTRFDIRGVFEGRPYTAVNGSLWTLPYEVWCYIILLLIFVGFRSTQIRIAIYALIVAALAAWTLAQFKVPLTGFEVSYFGKLAAFFYIGALFAVHAIKPPLLSSRRMHWFSKGGDPSYGMYIFAWPIQQYCSIWIEGFWTSMAAAFLLTMLTGYFTWHVFERRCIQSVGSVAAMVRQKFSFAYRANRSI